MPRYDHDNGIAFFAERDYFQVAAHEGWLGETSVGELQDEGLLSSATPPKVKKAFSLTRDGSFEVLEE